MLKIFRAILAHSVHQVSISGAAELLNITVGTQSISPLYWAIESGSLNTAKAMLEEIYFRRFEGISCSL